MRTYKLNSAYIVSSMRVIPTVSNNNTFYVGLAVGMNTAEQFTAVYTSKLSVSIHLILMTKCRNGSTPVDYGTAAIMIITLSSKIFNRTACASYTEYAIFISAFSTCRSLTLSLTGSTDMETPLSLSIHISIITVHFCLNNSFIRRESHNRTISIGNKTCLGRNYQSIISCTIGIPHCMRSQDIILILLLGIIGNIILTNSAVIHPALCHPDTYRQFSKNGRVRNLFTVYTRKRNNGIIMSIYIILSRKSVSNLHTLQFPIIYIIKINCSSNRINVCKIISNQAYPIEGACRQQTIISRNLKTNCALLAVHNKLTNDITYVTLIITDLHYDSMNAIVKVQIRNSNSSVKSHCNICTYLNAINVNLDRIAIQSGSISLSSIFISLRH